MAIFDVQLIEFGITICNLTLEHSRRDGELVLGYPASKIRRRLPKTRQQLCIGMTPEKEAEIFTEANYELSRANHRGRRKLSPALDGQDIPQGKSVGGFTLPIGPEDWDEEKGVNDGS